MAVLANGGTSSGDVTASARTQPTAAIVRVRTGASGATRSSTCARASVERDQTMPCSRT